MVTDVSETTRQGLQDLIEAAFTDGMSPADLVQAIRESFLFSADRAETIARTELGMASVAGSLEGWRASGVVEGKQWLLSDDHPEPDECDDNDDVEVGLDENFPSGDEGPPAHPNCECDVIAVVAERAGEGADEEG